MRKSPSSLVTRIVRMLLTLTTILLALTGSAASLANANTTNDEFVHLVFSSASLLSGGSEFSNCQNATDTTCSGGVAAVAAYARYKSGGVIPTLFLPMFDYQSPFVQQHPLAWETNRLVMSHLLGWKLFLARSWFLGEETTRQREMEGLQSQDWPLLISNVVPPPSNSWHHFTRGIFFDEETNLAVIHAVREIGVADYSYPKIESTHGLLDHIARVNQLSGCTENTNKYDKYINRTAPTEKKCWIPVVVDYLAEYDPDDSLLLAVADYKNPPALYLDYMGIDPTISEEPKQRGNKGMWALSFRTSSREYQQIKLQLNEDRSWINKATFETQNIKSRLLEEVQDDQYESDIAVLRQLSDETIANDPVVGSSNAFPVARKDEYVRCEGGECLQGNLFTDAYLWATGSDFAFENSGTYHGPGWPEGPVRVSHLWGAVPFSNNLCTGTMSGISIFKMFNFSTSVASFSSVNTAGGGKLLQVSGMRVTYNTELEVNRLIKLEIWDKIEQRYLPVERLKMYKFVTNSYVCVTYEPYNKFIDNLIIPGEVPGTVGPIVAQEAAEDYLRSLNKPYKGQIEGRLVNDTNALTPLNMFQTEESCDPGTYWDGSFATCFLCPVISEIILSLQDKMEFHGVSGESTVTYGEVSIKNDELFPVDIHVKSIPPFLSWNESLSSFFTKNESITIESGDRLHMMFRASSKDQDPGIKIGEVVFGVMDGGSFPGCIGTDISFEVSLESIPQKDLNQLGSMRIVGWTLAAFASVVSASLTAWCLRNRKHQAVRIMQPTFLVILCVGVFVMGLTIIPFSIDDEIASAGQVGTACMAGVWLLSMGFSITFAALFSKLWRINKILKNSHHCRHVTVRERDVLIPFSILCTINVVLLLLWTVIDPLQWVRRSVEGEPWNTYGVCASNSNGTQVAFTISVCLVNFGALLLACWQAYKARNVSYQYSEARGVGMAIFTFLQIAVVGVPVIFLLDETNVIVVYFVKIYLVFGACMSLLLWIFVPMVRKVRTPNHSSTYPLGSRGNSLEAAKCFSRPPAEVRKDVIFVPMDRKNRTPQHGDTHPNHSQDNCLPESVHNSLEAGECFQQPPAEPRKDVIFVPADRKNKAPQHGDSHLNHSQDNCLPESVHFSEPPAEPRKDDIVDKKVALAA